MKKHSNIVIAICCTGCWVKTNQLQNRWEYRAFYQVKIPLWQLGLSPTLTDEYDTLEQCEMSWDSSLVVLEVNHSTALFKSNCGYWNLIQVKWWNVLQKECPAHSKQGVNLSKIQIVLSWQLSSQYSEWRHVPWPKRIFHLLLQHHHQVSCQQVFIMPFIKRDQVSYTT